MRGRQLCDHFAQLFAPCVVRTPTSFAPFTLHIYVCTHDVHIYNTCIYIFIHIISIFYTYITKTNTYAYIYIYIYIVTGCCFSLCICWLCFSSHGVSFFTLCYNNSFYCIMCYFVFSNSCHSVFFSRLHYSYILCSVCFVMLC